MSTLREAAIGAMGALETARNGLAWYRDRYPESTDGSDDEAAGDIDAAIDALRDELAKPDARPAPAEPQPAAQQSKPLLEWQKAVMEAYGHLWHVNNEPAAPIPMRSPEKAAYEARKCLRELLTKEERGEAINAVGQLIGRGITATKGDRHD